MANYKLRGKEDEERKEVESIGFGCLLKIWSCQEDAQRPIRGRDREYILLPTDHGKCSGLKMDKDWV